MAMIWEAKRGSGGVVYTGTLSDAGGPIDLTGKTVTLNVRASVDSPKIMDNHAVANAANQTTTGKGGIACTFTFADLNIPVVYGGYLLEFKIVSGPITYFIPTEGSDDDAYGRLVIKPSL